MIDGTVKSLLTGSSAISTLVSDRVYPDHPDTDPTLPYLVYYCELSDDEEKPLNFGTEGTYRYTITVECWGSKVTEVINLKAAARTALHHYRSGTVQGMFYQSDITPIEERAFHRIIQFTALVNS